MYKDIIKSICDELGIKCSFLSKDWVMMLEYKDNVKFISGFKFDLNGHAAGMSVDDKYAMYEILKSKSVPVIEHNIMYDENNKELYAADCKDRKLVYDYFLSHNNDIVIKGNTGTCGDGVYHVSDVNDIDNVLDKVFRKNFSISVCPFYNIEREYRVIMLNGNPQIVYGKVRPIVYGDGYKLISELLHEFNPSYKYNVKEDRILSIGEEYVYSWQHNLSKGAILDLDVSDKDVIIELAKKTAKALDLSFGSVDIIKTGNEYLVLECNSGVMMSNLMKILPNGYDIAKDIYKKAIMSMFNME